jgi:hypothetical protein
MRDAEAPVSDRRVEPAVDAARAVFPGGDTWILPAEPAYGVLTTTATGHRATLTHCRCGLPVSGEGWDVAVDPEPLDVVAVTVLGQVPGVARWDRGADGLWHPGRSRYQSPGPSMPWRALGVCGASRRHRVIPVASRLRY